MSPHEIVLRELDRLPLVSRFLGPSLRARLATDSWYENWLLRLFAHNPGHVKRRMEPLFAEARLDQVDNAEEIFSDLRGTDQDYDNKFQDFLAEVQVVRWGRQQGIEQIRKINTEPGLSTPDFSMRTGDEILLAEAKHFRTTDYLLDFICDRLEGLALAHHRLQDFGLQVHGKDDYDDKRDGLAERREQHIASARADVTPDFLRSLEQELVSAPEREIQVQVAGITFHLSRQTTAGRVTPAQTAWTHPDLPRAMLSRMRRRFLEALRQIHEYSKVKALKPARAVVLLRGAEVQEWDWGAFWEELCWLPDPEEWKLVDKMFQDGEQLVGVPAELIVRQGVLTEYGPFPRSPEDCPQLALPIE